MANSVDPDQMPHYVASDLGLDFLPMTFYGFPGKNGLSSVADLSGCLSLSIKKVTAYLSVFDTSKLDEQYPLFLSNNYKTL